MRVRVVGWGGGTGCAWRADLRCPSVDGQRERVREPDAGCCIRGTVVGERVQKGLTHNALLRDVVLNQATAGFVVCRYVHARRVNVSTVS